MIEEELRAAMLAHDADAPRAATFDPVVPHRSVRAPGVLLAVIVTVALVVGISVLWTRGGSDHRGNTATPVTSCPARYSPHGQDPQVPRVPSLPQVAAPGALTPGRAPRQVVVCAYLHTVRSHRMAASAALTGSRELTGNLESVTNTLSSLPTAVRPIGCTAELRPTDLDNYLIMLRFAGGVVWVAAPGNHCAGAGNGRIAVATNLLPWVGPAYSTGRWPSVRGVGRRGQDEAMVPPGAVSLTINAYKVRRTVTHGFEDLVSALDAAPTTTSDGSCGPSGPEIYELTFQYTAGTDVLIRMSRGCYPEVDNGSLAIRSAAPFLPQIRQLLRQK